MAYTFRKVMKWLVPGWAYSGEGAAKLDSWAWTLDDGVARLREGATARFPSYSADDALALLGDDRGIPRGRDETSEHYASRLLRWRSPRGHRVRGNAFALLEQVAEYWGIADSGTLRTYDCSGNIFRLDGGVEYSSHGSAWRWDSRSAAEWSRFWLEITSTLPGVTYAPDFGDPALWGGALGTPGYAVGVVGATSADFQAMRDLLYGGHSWRPAGTQPEWLTLGFGLSPEPAGAYEHWSLDNAGAREATRDGWFRYVSLDVAYNNTYAGDASVWSSTFPLAPWGAETVELTRGELNEDQSLTATFATAPSNLWVDIASPGAPGSAGFVYSLNGGSTWLGIPPLGDPITVPSGAGVVDLGNGIVLTFGNELESYYSDAFTTIDWVLPLLASGDPETWDSITLPNGGASYDGDPSLWSDIRLVDDGDPAS